MNQNDARNAIDHPHSNTKVSRVFQTAGFVFFMKFPHRSTGFHSRSTTFPQISTTFPQAFRISTARGGKNLETERVSGKCPRWICGTIRDPEDALLRFWIAVVWFAAALTRQPSDFQNCRPIVENELESRQFLDSGKNHHNSGNVSGR